MSRGSRLFTRYLLAALRSIAVLCGVAFPILDRFGALDASEREAMEAGALVARTAGALARHGALDSPAPVWDLIAPWTPGPRSPVWRCSGGRSRSPGRRGGSAVAASHGAGSSRFPSTPAWTPASRSDWIRGT